MHFDAWYIDFKLKFKIKGETG